jgi:hypothetical protein
MLHPATDDLIKFLNEVTALDRDFMFRLLKARVPCNQKIADHPSIQVGRAEEFGLVLDQHEGQSVEWMAGVLGLLNGFCGTIGGDGPNAAWGPIACRIDDDGNMRFIRTEELPVDPIATGR